MASPTSQADSRLTHYWTATVNVRIPTKALGSTSWRLR